jgi:hypothetical protein
MHDKEYRKRDAPRIECKILVFLLAVRKKKEDFPIYAIGQDLQKSSRSQHLWRDALSLHSENYCDFHEKY